MAHCYTIHSLFLAMELAAEECPRDGIMPRWVATTPEHQKLLALYKRWRETGAPSIGGSECLVSDDPKELEFRTKLELEPIDGHPSTVLHPGSGKKYPSISLTDKVDLVRSPHHPELIATFTVVDKGGEDVSRDRIFITPHPKMEDLAMFERAHLLKRTGDIVDHDYDTVLFPRIALEGRREDTWAKTLPVPLGYKARDIKLIQQASFLMSPSRLSPAKTGTSGKSLIIDRPFLLWAYRHTITEFPFFVGWFDEKSWESYKSVLVLHR